MKKLIALVCIAGSLGSCATPQTDPAPAAAMKCVFYSNRDAKVFAEFKGQKVGFCCQDCETKWSGLMEAKKDRLLATYDR